MTSDGTRECFVHVVLPGETAFVPAARFQVTVDRMGSAVGRLVYGRSYLAHPDAVPIDPVELPLAAGTFETRGLDGLFGALRDAGPDHWGRRVIERHSDRRPLDPLDYLLLAPDDRAGALGFGLNAEPPSPRRLFNRTLELEHLQRLADAIVAEEQLPDEPVVGQVEELLLIGTAMGGARPKVVVEDQDALWIAKFNRPDDAWNAARVEHAMLLLARECGLHAASSRVVTVAGRDVLLVKRFDREYTPAGYRRARMLSALTLLRAGDTHLDRGRWSYVLLAEALRRVVARAAQDAPELFRRMVFNALISNTDDHPRNHAVIALDVDWALSPAYDLTPATPVSLERRDLAMDCGDDGRRAQAANLLSQSARFLLTVEQARATVDEMEQLVRGSWYEVARRAGVSERDCARIAPAFAYPGFRLG
jgi:serine/threonine-protein kinase HipA